MCQAESTPQLYMLHDENKTYGLIRTIIDHDMFHHYLKLYRRATSEKKYNCMGFYEFINQFDDEAVFIMPEWVKF